MQIGVDDMMRSKLREIEKKRDQFDVKYETSRFEQMVGFGSETASEAREKELEEINRQKLIHEEKKRQEREMKEAEERERQR